jgi:hypothetical protein
MLCEGVLLISGNRNEKKVEKSDGVWWEIAYGIASNFRVLKDAFKEKAAIIWSETEEPTYSSEMISQVNEVSDEIMALCSQSFALGRQFGGSITQFYVQHRLVRSLPPKRIVRKLMWMR